MNEDRHAPNFFAGPYIDRRSEARESLGWLDEARADAETLFLVGRGTAHLIHAGPQPRIAYLQREHPSVQTADPARCTLLGWYRGARCVLVELDTLDDNALEHSLRFEELRPLASELPAEDASLLAYARALSIWRARHRYCGVCGSPTTSERAGHALRCSNTECAQQIFPRIDPAIIVLVTDGDRALMGRQADWPAGRYSTLAGFVEPGESLEDAVVREVFEETGVEVASAEYQSSQPWPFPSSLMLGFQARAGRNTSIQLGAHGELEDARWFTREDIATAKVRLPTRYSISYRLVETWFDRGSDRPLAALNLRS